MKVTITAIIAIFSSCLSLPLSADEVTRKSLPDLCPKLEIRTREVNAACRGIEINIPANEVRFKRLFQAWFVVSDKNGELALRVPIQIVNLDGVRRISVDASPEILRNARIDLDCKMKDPTMSSLDTVTLVLPSLVGPNDSSEEKGGKH